MATLEEQLGGKDRGDAFRQFPWWLIAIIAFLVVMALVIVVNPEYNEAFQFIKGSLGAVQDLFNGELLEFIGQGISLTLYITVVSFLLSLLIGLIVGVGRVSKNTVFRNMAIFYVEFIRGVPMLVLIFTIAFVLVPTITDALGLENRAIPNTTRGIIALSVIYGAFMAEIFRAGIESIPKGQTEAARSLGMTAFQSMRHIILPQAIRNVLPALGNDFIATLKDSSLLSVLAVREITQMSRLYAGSSFRFREAYLVLTFMYLTMTLALSLLLRWYENRIRGDEG
ncbi:MAG: amino acid ABC transporter permease [Chloroflexota bacterium]|jgi:polar amino acid transport system permease protein